MINHQLILKDIVYIVDKKLPIAFDALRVETAKKKIINV